MAANFLYSNRDVKFILKEWLNSARVFELDKYKDYYSPEDIDVILDQIHKIMTDMVAPTNDDGENMPARIDDGQVTIPPSFHKVYRYLIGEGWGIGNFDETAEGTLPLILYGVIMEYLSGANPAFTPYMNLSGGAAELIQSFGSEWDKKTFLPRMFGGEWSGTMCLTEAGGGSDVGDTLSKAYPTETPGVYKIKGSKVFITAGDHDMCENIIHLLLARVDGAAKGTRGLSLFIVPKIWVNQDGTLGKSNDVLTVSLEHKMGLKGSATAVLNFGENDNCRGILLGSPPDENGISQGMAQMFQMMNFARMQTGHAALAAAAVAYFNAVDYARNRIQGRLFTNPKAGRVPIIKHEDVKRMLLTQKAITEAMRALIFKTYYYFDISYHSENAEERKAARQRIDINTPLVKAYCSDMAWPLIAEAIQVYGGYGFSEEYPVAQLARDCKVYSLWEGTNFIQSMDLVGRKWTSGQGEPFNNWLKDIDNIITTCSGQDGLAAETALMKKALDSYQEIRSLVNSFGPDGKPAMMPLYSTRVLHATAQLYCGALMLEQGALALQKANELGPDHYDFAFYQGKVDSARFFIKNLVPNVFTLKEILTIADDSALVIPEEALGI